MKLEIKKDMYIRTKDGIIDKVIFDYNGHCASPNCECKHISCAKNYYDEDKVVKASYNIIDVLEVGDYVNGLKVIDIVENDIYISDFYAESYIGMVKVKGIKSIVTKEQFEQMAYKVV